MTQKNILIIDDEELIRKVLDVKLKALDCNTFLAHDGQEALDILKKNRIDIAFCDIFMPGMDGYEVLKAIKKTYKDKVLVIIMTAFANLKTAIKAFKFGAFDYLIKPFTMEEIPYVLNRALKFQELMHAVKKKKTEKTVSFSEVVGTSDYVQNLKKELNRHTDDFSPCLIHGPAGTGKKYLARVMASYFEHKLNDEPYYVNLLSYDKNKEQLIDTVFKKDFIKEFNTNVVIIDNCHLINDSMQRIMLNNFQDNIKYIFITDKKITHQNYKRYFNPEFYSFFKDKALQTVPLNEHKEDIPLLIQHFIKIYNAKYDKKVKDIDKNSFYYLLYYDWPDNIIELESIIEKVVLLSEDTIIKSDLLYDFIKEHQDLKMIILNPRLNYKDALRISRDTVDEHYFRMALKITNNNKSKAARMLGVSLRQFQYRCKSMDL